ncbi:haloacid dehalogenase superfamily, subfamily IA, variant 3 with third motif having DD or ED/haloacid dehalogenase superfamily, subfamily IA, variant 1 with third motif having Dx(3-4)D or Dx(3-4)E [Tenacibaculum sp. MAR_2009_124]|uniref:HAD family hydrolase n=1 Tax=Tenacibaculum sp. MAR_2009_124 TaxID=1250059 RepID=UPI00089A05AF|nr:HAD family phosphatase [Tenacibaculum sp. MAR_2009_124]SEB43176.1 haloacid dehalogenase superfamily, subfamily IA, variant 3 with third motif having DD or ED/haloacid dehalogenase superfamily, subfamily IA, variant 1 with third motif having Dx(3-4)D or Dx(3-4)E [Tenacibaculum sp. MAR_2009_124]
MKQTLKAVFFDFDGTIVNSEIFHYQCFVEVLNSFDVHIEESDYFLNYAGIPIDVNSERIVAKFNLEVLPEELVEKIEELVIRHQNDHEPIFMPYAEESIKYYKNKGLTLGIVTASPFRSIVSFFKKKSFEDHFNFTVTFDDVNKSKPDPECYLQALEKSKYKSSEVIVFEDTENGVKAAKAAGLTCFAIQSEKELHFKLEKADKVFNSLQEANEYVATNFTLG